MSCLIARLNRPMTSAEVTHFPSINLICFSKLQDNKTIRFILKTKAYLRYHLINKRDRKCRETRIISHWYKISQMPVAPLQVGRRNKLGLVAKYRLPLVS